MLCNVMFLGNLSIRPCLYHIRRVSAVCLRYNLTDSPLLFTRRCSLTQDIVLLRYYLMLTVPDASCEAVAKAVLW